MARSTTRFVIGIVCTIVFLLGTAGAHDSLDGSHQELQFEDTVFEANGSPLFVLNARARIKNVGTKGYRGSKVHFFFRLSSGDSWTLIGQRLLPGIPPGDSVVCDLVTSTEGLSIVDSDGEVRSCQYRMEVHYANEVAAEEGEFHPACLHDHGHNGEPHHGHDH